MQEAHLALLRIFEASQSYESVLSQVAVARELGKVAPDDKIALAEFLFNTMFAADRGEELPNGRAHRPADA